MTIRNRLKILIAEKEMKEKRRLTYRTIAKETGISTSTLSAYINQSIESYAVPTLEALCKYFNCTPGDIIVFEESHETPSHPQA
jgi:putative transcriptional regulator